MSKQRQELLDNALHILENTPSRVIIPARGSVELQWYIDKLAIMGHANDDRVTFNLMLV